MSDILTDQCDVLIIGGGMAAAWAAIAAAKAGASTILVDKGYVGTSGVTATAGPNHWWIPPDPARRREAIEQRVAAGLGLGDPVWMERVIDTTWRTLPDLAPFYRFGSDGQGGTYYSGVRGAEYMRGLRAYAAAAGARILDHHPALQLLTDDEGAVVGARGHARLTGADWEIRAAAVVMATGGCAFRSGLIGSHGNTGDGYLMAVEAGADLSGMEFSIQYTVSPAWASTRTLPYGAARYYDAEGVEIVAPPRGHAHYQALGAALLKGPVYADLIDAPAALPPILKDIQPFTPPPFVRKGVDLFKERWPIKLFGEGTIRGNGGLRIVDADCGTNVTGLYAAGDAATRELATGAISGGGAVNSAWALTSGQIAGAAAARRSLALRGKAEGVARAIGSVGIAPASDGRDIERKAIEADVDHHMNGYLHSLWRSRAQLSHTLALLDTHWRTISDHGRAQGLALVALRETAALTATARWCTAAALARNESRGIHVRVDAPALDPAGGVRLLTGGLKSRLLNYRGKHFSVRGPLNLARPVQGHPVKVQAGASAEGKRLAARTAEVVFTVSQTLEEAKSFYSDIKRMAADHGRNPDHVRVLPGVVPFIGRTDEEAREQFEYLQDLLHPVAGIAKLSAAFGLDLSGYPLDGPLPDLPATEASKGMQELLTSLARRENMTLRQLYKHVSGSFGHRMLVGSGKTVADHMEEWFHAEAADGYNIMFPYQPGGMDRFVEHVLPELQRRGVFRTEYEGHTLREHLGLPRPANRHGIQQERIPTRAAAG